MGAQSQHTPDFNNHPSRSEIWKKGCANAHVQMHPISDLCKAPTLWLPATHQVWTQSTQPFARYGKGCEHAHVQMHPTSDLHKSQKKSSWSLNTNQIWMQSDQRTWSYREWGVSDALSLGTCDVSWQAWAGIIVAQIRNIFTGDIE